MSNPCCSCHGYGVASPRREPAQVAVCFAVRQESRGFLPPNSVPTQVLITGMGAANASRRVSEFLSRNRPRLLLTCGFAGGLNPAHPLGRVVFEAPDRSELHERLRASNAVPGRFLHSNRVVITAREKAALFQTTGADAVEMESSVIQAICRERGIMAATVRVISDAADEDLPMDFNRFARSDASLSLPRLLWAIARQPSVLSDLVRFQKRLNQASAHLGRVLQALLAAPGLI